jgi:hypothetical protein
MPAHATGGGSQPFPRLTPIARSRLLGVSVVRCGTALGCKEEAAAAAARRGRSVPENLLGSALHASEKSQ